MRLGASASVRVKTGLLLGGGFLLLCLLASTTPVARWFLVGLGVLVTGAAGWECAELANRNRPLEKGLTRILYLFPILLPVIIAVGGLTVQPISAQHIAMIALIATVAAMIGATFAVILAGDASLEAARAVSKDVIMMSTLVGVGGASLNLLAMLPDGVGALVWLIGVVVSNDSAAYFAGSAVGGRRMAPHISPNKTMAGGFAGILVGIFIGVIFGGALLGLKGVESAFVALLVVLVAQLGDLAKSFVKRVHDAKDSGTLLPGHGGILDRCDGYFGAAPVVLIVLLLKAL